ncbi:MAG: sugar phosphate isomerase/epimerase family protein [Alphaproteobacteria bacterium]
MRIALCNEVIREMPFERQAAFAAAVGYDGLEIAPFTLDAEQPHRLAARKVADLRRITEDAGLQISGLHWLLVAPSGLSITSADPAVRDKTRAVMHGLIDLCAALGGSYLIHGSPEQRRLEPGREEAGRVQALSYFREAAERAEQAGVTYCLEPLSPVETDNVTSLAEAKAIVTQVGSPAFQAMIDCKAASQSETNDIPTLLKRHLPSGLIRHVHFNDPNRRGPGEGELAFAPIVKTLRELSYDGWIGVEPFDYQPDGAACAARAIGYIAGLKESLL